MKKQLVLVTVLIAALSVGLIVGCGEDNPNAVPTTGTEVSSIELRLQSQQISDFAGKERTMTITAIARNSSGVGVGGIQIDFAIQNPETYRGTIFQAGGDSTKTNSNGELTATYSVVLERSTSVVVVAQADNITKSATISLEIVDDKIGNISIDVPPVITAPPNESISATVTASLSDTAGQAISGVEVKFRTQPADLGYVDSETGITDNNGRVSKTFRTVANEYGTCTIFASVGSNVDSDSILITPRADPENITIYTSTPHIKVAEYENTPIDIIAVVTDERGVGVPRATVEFTVAPIQVGGSIFGSVDPIDTTDATGVIRTVFNTLGGEGKVKIIATVLPSGVALDDETISDEVEIHVELLTESIHELLLMVTPNYMGLQLDSTGNAQVRATVRDFQNLGIPDVFVGFDCSHGTISRPTVTDSSGVAMADFSFTPRQDWPPGNDETQLEVTIHAEIPGQVNARLSKDYIITVEKASSETGTLDLTSDQDSIFADNGLTFANLTALLKDANGQALSNREVAFRSTHGAVNSPVTTDSLGRALAVFTDVGVPSVDEFGEVVPSVITAVYEPMSLQAEIEVTIFERNPVAAIALSIEQPTLRAGSMDSTWTGATCTLANGTFAPIGTEVHFVATRGRFVNDASHITGNFGRAENYYLPPQQVGTDHIRAYVRNPDGTEVESNLVEITLVAGPPTTLYLNSDPDILYTNQPASFSLITALVVDTVGNPVGSGKLVNFVTTLGSLNRLAAQTDENGQAIVQLSPGVQAGVAQITATVNVAGGSIEGQTTVDIKASGANTIQLNADPNAITVAGGGGIEQSQLTATIFDANGNLVEQPTMVVFQLLNEDPVPAGCNINFRGQMDSTLSAGGNAIVTLNSGTESGGKLVRAYTWRDPERQDTVSVTISRVQVLSGPPDAANIDVNDEGDDAGGAVWAIEVSARVFDQYMNPCEDNIPVQFTCDSVATIGDSRTGNESRSGETEKGVAFAIMTYNSQNTFDTLTIEARIRTQEGEITANKDHALPLQSGVLVLQCSPESWMIDAPDFETANIMCLAELRDEHAVLINNAPILFTSNRGYFHWYNWFQPPRYRMYDVLGTPPEPVIKFTGWNIDNGHREDREDNGQATVFLRGIMWDFFLDDVSPEVNVQIEARVVGDEDVIADPVIVVITRHPAPG